MSYNSTAIIKNIQDIICMLDTDFDSYEIILDQIIADIVKNHKHIDAFISFLNSQLANSQSRKKGILLLNKFLPLCPQDLLEENCIAWLNNSMKSCQYETSINNEAYAIIKPILEICHATPELNKSITSGILGKIIENITKINNKNHNFIHVLQCLDICIRLYPGSCIPFKSALEDFLLTFTDYTNSVKTVRAAGKCLHSFQLIGGGGPRGINHKQSWKNQQLSICATINSIMDELFESVLEIGFDQKENSSILTLPNINSGNLTKINSNRMINLVVFLQEMLLGPFPTAKSVAPNAILNLISRGLSITSSTLGNQTTGDAINLASHLFFIHKNLLQLLQALIICLGCNLVPCSTMICKMIINNLKCTKVKDAANVKTFCELRLTAYQTLSLWITTAKAANGINVFADNLIPVIITDITPVANELNLLVQKTTPKHVSKKARKKNQQEQISQSSIAKNYSTVTKKLEGSSSICQKKICKEALDTLQLILVNSGHFLKPAIHKQLQEFAVKTIFNIQRGIITNPYEDTNCKLSLYKLLTTLVTSHHWNIPPPLDYTIYLLSKGQADSNPEISAFCLLSLSNLNSFVHPVYATMQLPLDIDNLKNELNIEEDKNDLIIESSDEERENPEIEINDNISDDTNHIIGQIESLEEEIDTNSNKEDSKIIENDTEVNENDTTVKEIPTEVIENEQIDLTKPVQENGIHNGSNAEKVKEHIEISDDEIMEQLTIEDEPEIIPEPVKSKEKNSPQKKIESSDDVIDLVDEEMITAFVDIVNE